MIYFQRTVGQSYVYILLKKNGNTVGCPCNFIQHIFWGHLKLAQPQTEAYLLVLSEIVPPDWFPYQHSIKIGSPASALFIYIYFYVCLSSLFFLISRPYRQTDRQMIGRDKKKSVDTFDISAMVINYFCLKYEQFFLMNIIVDLNEIISYSYCERVTFWNVCQYA